ncbi:MAG: hypothetical protein Q9209_006569 [Squamulea sp. 1 TL-2023]
MVKIEAHNLNSEKCLSGTSKKPPPLSALRRKVSVERIESILDSGASVEHRIGPVGRTLLLQEANEGRHAGVCLALDRGASITCMDDNGDTALALALRSWEPQAGPIVRELLDAGADISLNDGSGQPLLRVALANATTELSNKCWKFYNHSRQKIIDAFQNGSRAFPRTEIDLTIAQSAFCDCCWNMATGSEGLVEDLLSRDAQLNLDSALRLATLRTLDIVLTKFNPLTDACCQQMALWFQRLHPQPKSWLVRDTRVLLLLLEFGLDPDIRQTSAPHAPLIVCATVNGDTKLVEKLIAHKVILSASDDDSDPALICAAEDKNRAMYDTSKAAGANDRMLFLDHMDQLCSWIMPVTSPWNFEPIMFYPGTIPRSAWAT